MRHFLSCHRHIHSYALREHRELCNTAGQPDFIHDQPEQSPQTSLDMNDEKIRPDSTNLQRDIENRVAKGSGRADQKSKDQKSVVQNEKKNRDELRQDTWKGIAKVCATDAKIMQGYGQLQQFFNDGKEPPRELLVDIDRQVRALATARLGLSADELRSVEPVSMEETKQFVSVVASIAPAGPEPRIPANVPEESAAADAAPTQSPTAEGSIADQATGAPTELDQFIEQADTAGEEAEALRTKLEAAGTPETRDVYVEKLIDMRDHILAHHSMWSRYPAASTSIQTDLRDLETELDRVSGSEWNEKATEKAATREWIDRGPKVTIDTATQKFGEATTETIARINETIQREQQSIEQKEKSRAGTGLFGSFHRFWTGSDPYRIDIQTSKQKIVMAETQWEFVKQSLTESDPAKRRILINKARNGLSMRLLGADFSPEDSDEKTERERTEGERKSYNQEHYAVEQEAIDVSRDAVVDSALTVGTLGAGVVANLGRKGVQIGATQVIKSGVLQGLKTATKEGAIAGGVIGGGTSTIKNTDLVQEGQQTVGDAVLNVGKDTAIGAGTGAALGGAFKGVGIATPAVTRKIGSGIQKLRGSVKSGYQKFTDHVNKQRPAPAPGPGPVEQPRPSRARPNERAEPGRQEQPQPERRSPENPNRTEPDRRTAPVDAVPDGYPHRPLKEGGDPYEILGIDRNASVEQVKDAARKLSMKYHPDRTTGLSAEYRAQAVKDFKVVEEAYQTMMQRFENQAQSGTARPQQKTGPSEQPRQKPPAPKPQPEKPQQRPQPPKQESPQRAEAQQQSKPWWETEWQTPSKPKQESPEIKTHTQQWRSEDLTKATPGRLGEMSLQLKRTIRDGTGGANEQELLNRVTAEMKRRGAQFSKNQPRPESAQKAQSEQPQKQQPRWDAEVKQAIEAVEAKLKDLPTQKSVEGMTYEVRSNIIKTYNKALHDALQELQKQFPDDARNLGMLESKLDISHALYNEKQFPSVSLSKDCRKFLNETLIDTVSERDNIRGFMSRHIESMFAKGSEPVSYQGKEWRFVQWFPADKKGNPLGEVLWQTADGEKMALAVDDAYDILKQNGR